MKNITTFDLNLLAPFDKIWCLVSGGIDSTYLAELISERYPEKTYFVNCYNPYEQSKTLRQFKTDYRYMESRPVSQLNYKQILEDSFRKIPQAIADRKAGKYSKKIFRCCAQIKHKEFKREEIYKSPNSVVISGIKSGDGQQRMAFLHGLAQAVVTSKGMTKPDQPTFFYRHKEGQLYCYPFRDYRQRELPRQIITQLRHKYPQLHHSGCSICPVLVVFQDKFTEPGRTANSLKYYHKLIGQKTLI